MLGAEGILPLGWCLGEVKKAGMLKIASAVVLGLG
jgi:hypothetical protein